MVSYTFITTTGLVLSFGNGGHCGHKSSETQYTPKTIKALESKHIIYISTGIYHSLCIDNNGIIYSWGDGGYGRLGHGNSSKQQIPKQIEFFTKQKIKVVSCMYGYYHSAIITS
eukprot:132911_1